MGRAYEKQSKLDDAEKAYRNAAAINAENENPWLGLRSVYEAQGAKRLDDYITASTKLAEHYAKLYAESTEVAALPIAANKLRDDQHKCQGAIDKAMGFVGKYGSKSQRRRVLELQLPENKVIYDCLEGRLPRPSLTYSRLAEIIEEEEKEQISKLIAERRTRIGARKEQVTTEVKREIYGGSKLEHTYQQIINWTNDDELRHQTEEKLLRRGYDSLLILPANQKAEKRASVMKMAEGMVIIKHPYSLAWDIQLEWFDVRSIGEMDGGVLREYVTFFPDRGLSNVLAGYLNSQISPFPPPPSHDTSLEHDDDSDEGGGVSLDPSVTVLAMSADDRLVLMTEGLQAAKQSPLAHRLMGEYYTHIEEDETTVETLRAGLKLLTAEAQKSGLKLQNSFDAMNILLATALISYQSPRHHPEAKGLFNNILKRKAQDTKSLIGVGLILEEEEEYKEAVDYLSKALKRDPSNVRIGAEAAWCKALNGELELGLRELEKYYERMDPEDSKTKEMRAETLYRIGKCQWDINPMRDARKDRTGPYAKFLASIKTNANYPPAYTMLGIYYSDYARDRKRARQCFQKAFDLSGSEIEAAERLARSFADQSDWDIVEIIAQRVIESGKARPPPGSKKKGISWPYSALGVVQMNKLEYQQAIVSFLAALRISPDDYHSYVGLGESYHNSGRYNSALRTFMYAENPTDGVQMKKTGESWFTRYMLANVNRELGLFEEAIDGYKEVLLSRPKEFGVEIALLQTYLERAWRCIETGFFGSAVDSADEAFKVATSIIDHRPQAFNLWKGVADACSIYSWVQERLSDFPADMVQRLLLQSFDTDEYKIFADVDGIRADALESLNEEPTNGTTNGLRSNLKAALNAAILSQKRAIVSCSYDMHAQAIAWYNLGWMEYRAHVCLESHHVAKAKTATTFLKASIRCFKRAIELEAGNAEFWNALGVVTTSLNPKVAQHAFVRSLHLNERNVKAWANLGALYLLQGEIELAHTAFTRAQSTDPDYAHAWIGEGLVALIFGDPKEALLHFTHAFEISESSSAITKREYASHSFDALSSNSNTLSNALSLIQPLFALQQLHSLTATDPPFDHLSALYNERIRSHGSAMKTLEALCENLESEYEETESSSTLAQFAQAKADLARNQLAAHHYASATESAQTALDLTSEDEDMPNEKRRRLRLSARLTLGLASYYRQDMDAALASFKAALEASHAAPDVVCLLAEVLWAKGGHDERSVARDQLLECVERSPQHVGAVVLLGVMAAIEEDAEMVATVREELEALRVSEGLAERDEARVERVLEALAELGVDDGGFGADAAALAEIQKAVMIAPSKPTGWDRLSDVTGDPYSALMALKTALSDVRQNGTLEPGDVADAFAGTGSIADAQRAIMVAPWAKSGWESLLEALG